MKKRVLFLIFISIFANAKESIKEPLTIELSSYQKVVKIKDGKKSIKWIKPTKVVPGTTIQYVNKITNLSNETIKSATLRNKIDKNLIFIPKSIKSNLEYKVKFSVDGKHFAPASKLEVVKNGKKHLATPKEYRAIEFNLINIPPNSKNKISYEVKVK